ncbi:MAG: carbamoyl-phosphate synthase large subunit [Gammaproteobacteria bacterium]|jgi:acetyl/propionyl-CoA carboxylase alpha subunit/acetyl-CoA carboxylase carboxyltransferase component|nr:carbamoyl-phosphate synthase large subunit [Gammaproteobacteria bacterium]
MQKLLIANRGEIAIRIAQAAAEMGIHSIAVFPEDDASSLHRQRADDSVQIPGTGARAYLDQDAILNAAREHQANAIHPGYGFLSENADFAEGCENAGMRFVGPTAAQLRQFGDKGSARSLATECGVPLIPGTNQDTTLAEALAFFEKLNDGEQLLIKAISGGGGRGMRRVETKEQLEKNYERCRSESKLAFGNDAVYVEALIPAAKHIEIQIVGDGQGQVTHLWERECSVQRQNQKLVEIAPSPTLPDDIRQQLISAAMGMAKSASFQGLGTFEFLLDQQDAGKFYFIEANPRLQVEHTVTEEITGVDLVQVQLRIADGESLQDMGLLEPGLPSGYAIQCRINMETISKKGAFKPSGGLISVYEPPGGPGIRVDGFGYAGYQTSSRYDSLLAKLVVHSDSTDYSRAVEKARRALDQFRLEGFEVNIPFLANLLARQDFVNNDIHTRYVDEHMAELTAGISAPPLLQAAGTTKSDLAGIRLESTDPLAVLDHGKSIEQTGEPVVDLHTEGPENTTPITAPLQGTVIEISVQVDDEIYAGQEVIVMDAMKMEHVIESPFSGIVRLVTVESGDAVFEDHNLLFIEQMEVSRTGTSSKQQLDPDYIRPDLAEAYQRHSYSLDENREVAVAKRRKTGHRTVRENIADICDPDTFIEYGSLAIAAQRRRRSVEDLMENTPGDGMVTGIGSVNGELFPDQNTQCVVMSYDYMVLAGTQGLQNHRKKDRMFELAAKLKIPVILIAEGGGGRPGDTDGAGIAGLDCLAFQLYSHLSGLVPRIGITTGRCFAGNAVLLGCSDIVIATEDSNIGIGGPAMIEGGGLGIFRPEEVGPMDVQVPNGVVDIAVKDETEAMAISKKLLSYFQGPIEEWSCDDQRKLRASIPENRLRIYDIRDVIRLLADDDSVTELRPDFGLGMVTSFIRIEGRPVGLIANNPAFLSGAIDSEGSDKAARFMQLCDAFDIPIVTLCDTPGIMVGPEIEKTALVRHASRMFVTSTSLTVPLFSIVLRKGYGLGAQAMTGGGFKASVFTVTWPTGEFGGMGLEGAVKLGYRKELEAITDPEERVKEYEKRVAGMYDRGKAVNYATAFEIDEVIDPKDSRHWIMAGLKSAGKPEPRDGKKRPFIDTW